MSTQTVFSVERRGESRKERKARRAAERSALAALSAQTTDVEQEVEDFPLVRAPRWGRMADGFWGPAAPKLPSHRVTSLRFGVATPFLAEAGIGNHGAVIGADLEAGGLFAMDPWELYRARHITGPSMLSIGLQGTGKSTTNKAMACRLIALGRKVAVASDPRAEWVRVAHAVGGKVIEVGPGRQARLNPLDPGTRPLGISDERWETLVTQRRRQIVATVLSLLRKGAALTEYEHTALDLALTRIFATYTEPTLVHVMEALLDPAPEARAVVSDHGEPLGLALRRLVTGDLAGMFDQPSTVEFDGQAPMLVIDTSALLGGAEEALAIATACTSAWLDAVVRAGSTDFWLIVNEEGWSAMRDPKAVELMDARQRLAGEWGIANMLIMHELKDLDMVGPEGSPQRNQALGLMSKAQVKIIHRQARETAPLMASTLGLTKREQELVTRLEQGVALWKIGAKSFLVQTQLTDGEMAVFNTDAKRAG